MIGFLKNLSKRNKIMWLVISLIVLGTGITYGVWLKNVEEPHDDVHIHAGFKLFLNDEQIDFSINKYMYFEPCGIDEEEHTTLPDKVHLHDKVGDVVHVHAAGIKWNDLFESIKYVLPKAEAVFIKDGEVVDNFLDSEIQNEESIIIVYDGKKETVEYIKEAVTLDRVKEIAASKENCGSDT